MSAAHTLVAAIGQMPDQLLPARTQMALTLGFHIILVPLGVVFPLFMLIANYLGLRRDDADFMRLAERWSKVAAVTFAVGAVTGTVLSFEMGMLWPGMFDRFGDVIGLAVRARGDLLLPRGHLHLDLHLRMEALEPLGAFLERRADPPLRARRGVHGAVGQLLDEPARGLHHGRRG